MSQVVDVRNSGGTFVVLGDAVVLPSSSSALTTACPGSMRYNPVTQNVEVVLGIDPTTAQWTALYESLNSASADLAEYYHADKPYAPGTVLVVGGLNEVTACTVEADASLAGIVSTAPAITFNDSRANDPNYVRIVLKGRAPCNCIGPIRKGDLLTTCSVVGYAIPIGMVPDNITVPSTAIIGVALSDAPPGMGTVEVKV